MERSKLWARLTVAVVCVVGWGYGCGGDTGDPGSTSGWSFGRIDAGVGNGGGDTPPRRRPETDASEDTAIVPEDTREPDAREADDTGPVCHYDDSVSVRGTVRLHTLTRQVEPNQTVAGLSLSLMTGASYLSGRPEYLEGRDCGTARAKFVAQREKGTYVFPEVDVAPVRLALVASVDDSPRTKRDRFVQTVSRADNAPLAGGSVAAQPAFAVSKAAEARAARAADMRPGELERRGFLVGRVVDASGDGVAGLRVSGAGTPEPVEEAIYPTDDLTETRKTTSKSGVFIIPGASLANYVMIDENGEAVSTDERSASIAGTAATLVLEYTGG